MTEKTNPASPGKHSEAGRRHSLRTRISGVRTRIRRVHVIATGIVVAVLAVGGTAWAIAGGAGSPEAASPGSAGLEPAPGDSTSPATAGGFPVPTWTASESGSGGRGRGGGRPGSSPGENQQPGMPSDLSAERDGDTVVLHWTDNTNNEDGFTVFVTQGWASFQINVPAGTTRYDILAAEQDTRTCFAVVPFSWTNPVGSEPGGEWECTGRRRS